MNRVYLDYNATAPIRPEVMDMMQEAMWHPANASSVHAEGRKARSLLENARSAIADAISCFPAELVFTASGTEANNLALCSFRGRPCFISAIEHVSVLQNRPDAVRLPVDRNGVIVMEEAGRLLASCDTPPFVSLMLANNETGVIQPVAELAALVRSHGGILHCDAAQALGKIPLDVPLLQADMVTLSAHKCGGPQGVGALIVRQGVALNPMLLGGRQEGGRRAGTENIAAIAGFAEVVRLAMRDEWQEEMRRAHGALEQAVLQVKGARVLGDETPRLPNVSAIGMPGIPAETQLINFDLEGFAVSAGSACSSGRIAASHVGEAMGLGEAAGEVIRVSSGWNSRPEELEAFGKIWLKLARRLSR